MLLWRLASESFQTEAPASASVIDKAGAQAVAAVRGGVEAGTLRELLDDQRDGSHRPRALGDAPHLDGTDLTNALLDNQAQLNQACGIPAKPPAGFTPPEPCPPPSASLQSR